VGPRSDHSNPVPSSASHNFITSITVLQYYSIRYPVRASHVLRIVWWTADCWVLPYFILLFLLWSTPYISSYYFFFCFWHPVEGWIGRALERPLANLQSAESGRLEHVDTIFFSLWLSGPSAFRPVVLLASPFVRVQSTKYRYRHHTEYGVQVCSEIPYSVHVLVVSCFTVQCLGPWSLVSSIYCCTLLYSILRTLPVLNPDGAVKMAKQQGSQPANFSPSHYLRTLCGTPYRAIPCR
jgi:hypothetical protein